MTRALLAFALVTAILTPERIARACSRVPPREFTLYASDADDVTPPAAPTVTAVVQRYEGDGCLDDGDTCGKRPASAYVVIHVSTTDDRAPDQDIGYHDRNGNYSEPTIVTVVEDGGWACSSSRADSHVAIWLALGFVLWPRRRRR